MKNSQIFPLLCNCMYFWHNRVGLAFKTEKDPHFELLHTALENHTTHYADNHLVWHFLIVGILLKSE